MLLPLLPLAMLLPLLRLEAATVQQQQQPPQLLPWPIDFTFAQAQITAQCLQSFAEDLLARREEEPDAPKARGTLARMLREPHSRLALCRQNHNCAGCLNATVLDPRLPSCELACKDAVFCEQACKQLRNLAMHRPGSCPRVSDPRQCDASSCASDLDCVYVPGSKCCDTGLCRTCRAPTSLPPEPGLPPTPAPAIAGGEVAGPPQQPDHHLSWGAAAAGAANASSLLDPVIYVVQARYMVGPRFEPLRTGDWHVLKTIAESSLRLDEPMVGHFYQFRVAAVSARGSRGFGAASEPYSLRRTPAPPDAPSNLSEGRMRMYSSGRISVYVNWSPPKRSDLEVSQYQVTWVKDHGFVNSDGVSVLSVTQFKKTVPSDFRTCLIENLEPATSYKVEVRAASLWGDQLLTGPQNSIYITTLQADHSASAANPSMAIAAVSASEATLISAASPDSSMLPCSGHGSDKSKKLLILTPTFEEGSLSVKMLILGVTVGPEERLFRVQWRRRICIDMAGESKIYQKSGVPQGGYFKIDNLQFNCRYSVKLIPMATAGREESDSSDQTQLADEQASVIESCFRTPPCAQIRVASGGQQPVCRGASDAPTPGEPRDIRVHLLGGSPSDGTLIYRVSWRPPESARQQQQVTAYNVVWGPRKEEPINQESYSAASGLLPQIDTDRAVSRVLRKENTSLVIRNLSRATVYIVKLRTHALYNNQLMVSREKVYFFATEGSRTGPSELLHQSVPASGGDISRFVKVNWANGASALVPALQFRSLAAATLCIVGLSIVATTF